VRNDGDIDKALGAAAKTVAAEYYLPHLAHAAMEPPAATARFANGKCEIWAAVQSAAARARTSRKKLGLQEEDVTVNVTLLGGGFGRKVEMRLRAGGGPAVARDRRAGQGRVDARGRHPERLLPHRLGRAHRGGVRRRQESRRLAPSQRGADHPLDLRPRSQARGAVRARHGSGRRALRHSQSALREREAAAHVRIGWFRSVSNIPHCFAVQSFAAELAHEMERDPKDFLLELIARRASSIRAKSAQVTDFWNYGDPFETYPIRRLDARHREITFLSTAASTTVAI